MEVPDRLPERLVQGDDAIVKRDKVIRYLLDPDHAEGGHKARRWSEVFGDTRARSETLREDLRAGAAEGMVVGCRLARPSGLTWTVVLTITGPNGHTGKVRSNWYTLAPGTAPRLTSAWPD